MFGILFDDVSDPKLATKALNLTAELSKVVDSLKASPVDAEGLLAELATIDRGYKIIAELDDLEGMEGAIALQVPDDVAEPLKIPRRKTEQFYNYQQKNTKGKRQKDNENAVAIVRKFKSGDLKLEDLTDEDRMILGRYTGNGGNLLDIESGLRGSDYEYYTPKPIASGIWDVMNDIGFGGGRVLDPCAGVGVFGATAPLNTAIDAVELDETSGTINKLLNESESYNVTVSNFEKIASNTPDESYDAIVANVPFGSNRGRNKADDKKYRKESLEYYFIMRSLEKLKGGGLACFLVPDRCVTKKTGKEERLRHDSSLLAEFLGAYRLPNSVFGSANADVMTCVMFYRKYNRKALDKIDTLFDSGDIETLTNSNVLWSPFISGKYFLTDEGKKKVLGEKLVDAIKGDMYSRDQLLTDDDILTTAKRMMKSRLPRTRVNWDMFGEAIALPVQYNEGDTIAQKGQLLQLKNGVWVAIEDTTTDSQYQNLLARVEDPYNAFIQNVTLEQVNGLYKFIREMDLVSSTPLWITHIMQALRGKDDNTQNKEYKPLLIGLSVAHIIKTEGITSGINFHDKYVKLSKEMQTYSVDAGKLKGLSGGAKDGITEYQRNYKRSSGFSDIWMGKISEEKEIELNTEQSIDGLIYRNQSEWFSMEDAKSILGDDFDPYTSNEICISHDGTKLCRADDYYVGNLGEFITAIDQAIENTTDEKLKLKLLAQKVEANLRVKRVEVDKMKFNLYSPYVTIEEKCEFLRRSVHDSARVVDEDGVKVIRFKIGTAKDKDNRLKYIGRLEQYLKTGNLSLGGIKVEGVSEQQQIEELRAFTKKTEDKFNDYIHSNRRVLNRLEVQANDPKNLRFKQFEDETALNIQGMNPELKLHGYQTAFVRKMSREFSGINGFDVGLGKTFTALASVQYMQKIGVKKRTIFVVPSSTLSNWKKEAEKAYTDTSDCLYVGLRENKNGEYALRSSAYDEDLISIITNKPNKIYISFEAFERIKLKPETITKFENHIRTVDSSFMETDSKKKEEKTEAKLESLTSVLGKKSGSAPFFEDLGIDSIVIDEAHAFKNSSAIRSMNMQKVRFLSAGSEMSIRGVDAQCKTWYVRGLSGKRQDGVLLLTATPITNSPLEVYSMMSLAVGHERVNALAMGVEGADAFLDAFCSVETEDDETIDGQMVSRKVFKSLNNSSMLRGLISDIATIKTAEDVGAQIVVPDIDAVEAKVVLDGYTEDKLTIYKKAYRYAVDIIHNTVNPMDNEGLSAYEYVKKTFNEADNIVAHPFNLINKMSMLILDPDLDNQYTKYVVGADQKEALDKVLKVWNAKKPKEIRGRISKHAEQNDIKANKPRVNEETGEKTYTFTISVRAWESQGNVYIDSIDWETQQKFEDLAEKEGLNLDCTMSPKVAVLIQNLKLEMSNVRGVKKNGEPAPYAKQIIFCDTLGMHNKLKKLIVKHCGISASQIAIVTGQRNNKTSDIQDVQDSFNDYGEDKYRIIIANKKAEVGINLQIGTQAIHHLTIGWTPDSLHQRNGRGARQGNKTEKVTVYYYDASGTFDSAKRTLVNNKSEWISELMDGQGQEAVKITGGLSNEQMRALIDLTSEDEIQAFQDKIKNDERLRDEEDNRTRQKALLETAVQQRELYNSIRHFEGWAEREFTTLMQLASSIGSYDRLLERDPDSTKTEKAKQELIRKQATSKIRREAELKQAEKAINRLISVLGVSISSTQPENPADRDQVPIIIRNKFEEKRENPRSSPELFGYSHFTTSFGNRTSRYLVALDKDALEGTELYEEWSFESDSAKGLMEQSLKQFKERAKEDSALPADYADSFMKEGILSNGVPISKSNLVYSLKDPTEVYTVEYGTSGYGRDKRDIRDLKGVKGGKYKTHSDFELLHHPDYAVAYIGTAEYDKACRVLAEYEDGLVGNSDNKMGNFFSDKIGAVINYRQKAKEIAMSYSRSYLTANYYPHIIRPTKPNLTPFDKAVIELQSQVILRHADSYFFVSPDNQKAVIERNPISGQDRVFYVKEYAEKLAVNVVTNDFESRYPPTEQVLAKYIQRDPMMNQLVKAFEGYEGTSSFEFGIFAVDELRKAYSWIVDLEAKDNDFFRSIMMETATVKNAYNSKLKALTDAERAIRREERRALDAEIAEIEAKTSDPDEKEILVEEKQAEIAKVETEVSQVTPLVASSEIDNESDIKDTAIIRIEPSAGFNTRPYRDSFREYSDEVQKRGDYPKPKHWSKYNKKGRNYDFSNASACWNKEASAWEIPYGAWKLFKQRDPELTANCSYTIIYGNN